MGNTSGHVIGRFSSLDKKVTYLLLLLLEQHLPRHSPHLSWIPPLLGLQQLEL